jgi:UDP-2,4-diacetamido-2,4,6-trideoxy-beta-L-altropyranose hydrolase
MKVVIRTDTSTAIGSGHLMRCLTLAGELRARGAELSFVCRELPGNLVGLVAEKGYAVLRLPGVAQLHVGRSDDAAHASWLGASWETDASQTVAALEDLQVDWLVVDHYALDHRWEEILRPRVGRIMVIDDLADRRHDCDLLLDQNLYRDLETRYDSLVPGNCQKLLGPGYALLRPEFACARKTLRQRDGEVNRVLVFFGGVDLNNDTKNALHALAGIADRRFKVDVVVGVNNPHREQVKEFCGAHDGFHYHCQIDTMARLLSAADLTIGAVGATTLERCAMGVPSMALAVAFNQEALCDYLTELGIIIPVGKDGSQYQDLRAVINDKKLLLDVATKSKLLVDCLGVERVAAALQQ